MKLFMINITLFMTAFLALNAKEQDVHDSLPSYIYSPAHHVVHSDPENDDEDDVILHISYNTLLPQEREELKRTLSLWINSENVSEFPFTNDQVLFLSTIARLGPGNALSGVFAFKITEFLNEGKDLEEAAEQAFQYLETEITPRYLGKADVMEALENTTQDPELKSQYQTLKESLKRSATAPRDVLKDFYNRRMLANKDNEAMLDMLLTSSIGRNPIDSSIPSPLRPCDYWQQRKKSLFQSIDKARQIVPNAPFILAFQEITPSMFPDFKERFERDGAHIVSYNNGTGKKTEEPLADNEKIHRESFTSTLILSKEFEVIREELGALPTTSGCERRILGVEVLNKRTGKHLAVFTTHTDHIPSKELYVNTAARIHEFVGKFLEGKEHLPFVFSGDLNTFPDQEAAITFIDTLRTKGPFEGSHDYREGAGFHVPAAIAQSTFLGQQVDDFKALIGKDGKVQPNALDHSLFSRELNVLWGVRDAGVYDDSGNYVDPYKAPEQWLECLKQRQTASDHFLNATLFKIN